MFTPEIVRTMMSPVKSMVLMLHQFVAMRPMFRHLYQSIIFFFVHSFDVLITAYMPRQSVLRMAYNTSQPNFICAFNFAESKSTLVVLVAKMIQFRLCTMSAIFLFAMAYVNFLCIIIT